ncbi:MAG: hypothetical protein ABSG67_17570 [Thermoguttaceae bacterium]|jgi:hypothetical protein
MSGISGINSNDTNLLYILAQIAAQSGDGSSTDSVSADTLPVTSTDTQTGTSSTDATNANSLQEIIRQAVSSAIAEAEKSGNTSDLKSVIQNAVLQALKDNGIDVEKLQEQFAAGTGNVGHKHHGHHKQTDAAGQTTDAAATTNDNDSDDSSSTADTSSVENQTSPQIDAKTGDLLALLWSSQNNNQNVTGYLFDAGQ